MGQVGREGVEEVVDGWGRKQIWSKVEDVRKRFLKKHDLQSVE